MIFNPLNKTYKSILGAIPKSKKLKLRVKDYFDSVLFVCHKDGEQDFYLPMQRKEGFFELEIAFNVGLYFYCFKVNNNQFISKSTDLEGELTDIPEYYQLTFYDDSYNTVDWLNGGVIYQIFPDRFNISSDGVIKTNRFIHQNLNDNPIFMPNEKGEVENCDFFGGNLKGIIEKLDYIKSLGVTCIYLNPIFKANSNHRYDTGDYMQIDNLLGDINDFDELVISAERLGIKIILDGVFNHTGIDSLYFNKFKNYGEDGAYNNPNSEYVSWFDFISYPNEYNSWWGIKTLPATNKSENSKYVEFITKENGVLDYYTRRNIGGWRLDVVDELPGHFVKKINKSVKNANKNAIIIGEVWEDASNKISYGNRREYFLGGELDSVMNYPLKNAILDFVNERNFSLLKETILVQLDHYPKHVLDNLMNMLSTHDTFRLLSAVSGVNVNGMSKFEQSKISISKDELSIAVKRSKIASLLQFTLYGVPSIYYGDEIGMQGFSDPLNRKFYNWENGDKELLEWYKILGKIRGDYSCFKNGDIEILNSVNGSFVFTRKDNYQELLIAVNIGDSPVELSFDGHLINLLTNESYNSKICLQKFSMGIYKAE